MDGGRESDRQFCWEQIGKTNRAFRLSRVFAARREAERLLPLYALFSCMEQICSTVSDEDVARSKLNWWRIECLQNDPADSRHPVLKELRRSGARVDRASLVRLFDGAESRLDGLAPPDPDALLELCTQAQLPQLELELAASGFGGTAGDFAPRWSAAAGLLQLIRESARHAGEGGYWWVPLGLLARHGVKRQTIKEEPGSAAVASLMANLYSEYDQWTVAPPVPPATEADLAPVRHLFAVNGLYAGQLRRLAGTTPDRYETELNRTGIADLLAAWKSARAIRR